MYTFLCRKALETQCQGVQEEPLGQERVPLGPQALCCVVVLEHLGSGPWGSQAGWVLASGVKGGGGLLVCAAPAPRGPKPLLALLGLCSAPIRGRLLWPLLNPSRAEGAPSELWVSWLPLSPTVTLAPQGPCQPALQNVMEKTLLLADLWDLKGGSEASSQAGLGPGVGAGGGAVSTEESSRTDNWGWAQPSVGMPACWCPGYKSLFGFLLSASSHIPMATCRPSFAPGFGGHTILSYCVCSPSPTAQGTSGSHNHSPSQQPGLFTSSDPSCLPLAPSLGLCLLLPCNLEVLTTSTFAGGRSWRGWTYSDVGNDLCGESNDCLLRQPGAGAPEPVFRKESHFFRDSQLFQPIAAELGPSSCGTDTGCNLTSSQQTAPWSHFPHPSTSP